MTEAENMKKYDRRLITESKASRRLLASWRFQANYIIWRKFTSFFFDKYVCPILGKLHRLEKIYIFYTVVLDFRQIYYFVIYNLCTSLFFDKTQANYIIWREKCLYFYTFVLDLRQVTSFEEKNHSYLSFMHVCIQS